MPARKGLVRLWLFLYLFHFYSGVTRRKELTMLSQITIICRPTKDPELQTDKYGTLYTRVDAAVNPLYK